MCRPQRVGEGEFREIMFGDGRVASMAVVARSSLRAKQIVSIPARIILYEPESNKETAKDQERA